MGRRVTAKKFIFYGALSLFVVLALLPYLWIVSTAFKDFSEIFTIPIHSLSAALLILLAPFPQDPCADRQPGRCYLPKSWFIRISSDRSPLTLYFCSINIC